MKNKLPEPNTENRLLDPVERISEILFGLIMALTFTCTISLINANRAEVKDMLIGALGCNIAWGLVDAVMYLLTIITENGRGQTIYNFVLKTNDIKKAHKFITDALPPIVASNMTEDEIELLRNKLMKMPALPAVKHLTLKDFKMALGIFILVFLSTLPVVVPFIFISDVQIALRTSNAIAILMMFFCGWYLAKYAGRNRFLTGLILSLIGIGLVFLTIILGG